MALSAAELKDQGDAAGAQSSRIQPSPSTLAPTRRGSTAGADLVPRYSAGAHVRSRCRRHRTKVQTKRSARPVLATERRAQGHVRRNPLRPGERNAASSDATTRATRQVGRILLPGSASEWAQRALRALYAAGLPLGGAVDRDEPEATVGTRRPESCRARQNTCSISRSTRPCDPGQGAPGRRRTRVRSTPVRGPRTPRRVLPPVTARAPPPAPRTRRPAGGSRTPSRSPRRGQRAGRAGRGRPARPAAGASGRRRRPLRARA